ncbi:hypothetical protein BASA81_011148 [Batrachochytrium salamandrivorans]|nr:hypothetical protein BASA81_011148 [Batrachochytrium salamandrivorans]
MAAIRRDITMLSGLARTARVHSKAATQQRTGLGSAIELNKALLAMPAVGQLEDFILNTPDGVFNAVNLSTALSLLQRKKSASRPVLEKLLSLPSLHDGLGPRELSNVCYSLAVGGMMDKLPGFIIAQLEAAEFDKFTPQALAMCVFALSSLNQYPLRVWLELAAQVERVGLGEFAPQQELTRLLRGFAHCEGFKSDGLLHQLDLLTGEENGKLLEKLTDRNLASLIWSAARLGTQTTTSLANKLSGELAKRAKLDDLRLHEGSNLVWALVELKIPLPNALLDQISSRLPLFSLRGLSTLLAALVQSQQLQQHLLLIERICQQIALADWTRFASKDLALALHSLAIAEHKHVELFQRISKEMSIKRVQQFSNSDFASILQSLAKFRKLDELALKTRALPLEVAFTSFSWRKVLQMEKPVLARFASEFAKRDSNAFTPSALVRVLDSFHNLNIPLDDIGKLEQELQQRGLESFSNRTINQLLAAIPSKQAGKIFSLVTKELDVRGLSTFTWQDLCQTARALVMLGKFNARQFASEVKRRDLRECTYQDLAMLAWVFASGRASDPELLGRLYTEVGARDLTAFSSNALCSVALSLAHSNAEKPTGLVGKLCAQAASPQRYFMPQEQCNLMWAFSCLDELGEARAFFHRAFVGNGQGDLHPMYTVEAAQQLLQTELAWNQAFSTPSPLIASWLQVDSNPGHHRTVVGDWARNLVQRDTFRDSRSMVQELCTRWVGEGLRGERLQREALLETCLLVDMYVPTLRVVIEVNGPLHYLLDGHTDTGKSAFKARLLKRSGYRVFAIHVVALQQLTLEDQRKEMIALAQRCLLPKRTIGEQQGQAWAEL